MRGKRLLTVSVGVATVAALGVLPSGHRWPAPARSFRQDGQLHTVTGLAARPGYDLSSGVGTLSAPGFVRELAKLWVAAHPRR
jgi:hypothetical protein